MILEASLYTINIKAPHINLPVTLDSSYTKHAMHTTETSQPRKHFHITKQLAVFNPDSNNLNNSYLPTDCFLNDWPNSQVLNKKIGKIQKVTNCISVKRQMCSAASSGPLVVPRGLLPIVMQLLKCTGHLNLTTDRCFVDCRCVELVKVVL